MLLSRGCGGPDQAAPHGFPAAFGHAWSDSAVPPPSRRPAPLLAPPAVMRSGGVSAAAAPRSRAGAGPNRTEPRNKGTGRGEGGDGGRRPCNGDYGGRKGW